MWSPWPPMPAGQDNQGWPETDFRFAESTRFV